MESKSATGASKLVAVIGPPGGGKTSTLVKMAANYGLRSHQPIHFLSLDSQRVAASEQLRSYAAILGAGFQLVESPMFLEKALKEVRHKKWIWIDTPGMSKADSDVTQELASVLHEIGEIDIHLVLSAISKPADLRLAIERFAIFEPGSLLFTHVDETECIGSLLSVSMECGKPISFLCTGQQIPEDMEPATPNRLLGMLVDGAVADDPQGRRSYMRAGSAVAGS